MALELPVALPEGVDPGDLVLLSHLDKKRQHGERRMVLPLAGGGAEVFEVGDDEFAAALR